MKITLESTTRVIQLNGIDCRIWEGQTESGVKVQALIPRIAAKSDQDLSQFDRELKECRAPSADVQAFPSRMIL